jgi:hypothetical protein
MPSFFHFLFAKFFYALAHASPASYGASQKETFRDIFSIFIYYIFQKRKNQVFLLSFSLHLSKTAEIHF